ncbi:MAG: hypothetical protein AAFY56_21220, partial [Pseudomonadota bacterium]
VKDRKRPAVDGEVNLTALVIVFLVAQVTHLLVLMVSLPKCGYNTIVLNLLCQYFHVNCTLKYTLRATGHDKASKHRG